MYLGLSPLLGCDKIKKGVRLEEIRSLHRQSWDNVSFDFVSKK